LFGAALAVRRAALPSDRMTPLLWGIAAFMLFQFAIGVWVSRRVATEDDYLVAGRSMGPILVTGSIFATWFGAETVLGGAGRAHERGVSIASTEPFAYGLCIVLAGIVFAAPIWRRRLTTLADLYRDRYSVRVERVAAVVLIPSSLLWAAAQIRAFGQVLVVSGASVELELALAIACAFVILYTAVGGLLADAATDVFQAGLLTLGLVVLLGAVVLANHGIAGTVATIAARDRIHFLPSGDLPFWETLEAWAIPVLGSVTATELLSRMIGARSASVARNSALGAGAAYVAVGSLAVMIGLAGGGLIGEIADAEQVVPTLARSLLHPFAYVIFAGGFISAILSTVDSTLLVSAGLLSHNLVIPALRAPDERIKVRINRVAVAAFGIIAWLIARRAEGVSAIVEMASAFGSAGILVTVTFGLFTRFGGARAAMATIAVGVVSFVAASMSGITAPFLISLAASVTTYVLVATLEGRGLATPARIP
jgi:Na+/proline symporter